MSRLLAPCRTKEAVEFLVPIIVLGCWREGRYVQRLWRSQAGLTGVIVPWCVCCTSSLPAFVLEEKTREELSVSESHVLFHSFL